ncbi:MAG TPA: SMC-Scp complex subunit ScpB, partial [Chitinophagaceae bacterium]|nr:SMC-Scp complex subunit ScpB [Chitinophagaceae bacterium]
KQPVTKGQVEAIRGVSADYAIQKLLEKELIVISGRNETMPGHPLVYATSKSFMDYFGINSPEDLPKIKEVLAEQMIEPTIVTETDFISESANTEIEATPVVSEEPTNLAVTESGELIENNDEQNGEES